MDTQVSWSKNSIVNLSKDEIQSTEGNVTVNKNSSTLILNGESKAIYKYAISATDNYIKCNKLQFILNVRSNDRDESTRYSDKLTVHVQLEYWQMLQDENGTSWTPGRFDTFEIPPYLQNESDGYINEYIVEIDNQYIRNITISYIYKGENTITFQNPQVYNSVDVYDVAGEYGGGGGSAELKDIMSAGFYNNGAVIYYRDEDMPATLIFEDINDKTWLVDVSAKYKMTVTINDGNVPYGGGGA